MTFLSLPHTQFSDSHYDLLPVGVCIIDRELNLYSWNKTLIQWSGISQKDAVGKNLSEFCSEAGIKRFRVRVGHVFDSQQSIVLSPSLHDALIPVNLGSVDQCWKMVQRVTVQPMPEQGDFALVCIEDVTTQYRQNTELRRERKKLRHSESQVRAINNATPESVLLTDPQGVIIEINRAGLEMMEADSSSDLIGKSLIDFVLPEYQEGVKQMSESACAGNRITIEYVMQGLKGTRRWMRTTSVPLELEQDHVVQLSLAWDISAQKRSEIALRKAHDEAQVANKAKNEFLANMSHEIRTPMTAIMGYADILHNNSNDPDTLEATYTIKRNGEHLLEIINDILDYSNLDTTQLRLESKNCCPVRLVNECAKRLMPVAKKKNLDLKLTYQGDIPSNIFTNPDRYRQVLTNIIGNAIKFTDSGEVKVVVHSEGREEGMLLIDVIDTGIGIRDEDLTHLFEPFTQADYSLSRKYGGTGLGLAISRYLTENLGGEIKVTSEVGQGSTFSISIAIGDLTSVEMIDGQTLNPEETPKVIKANLGMGDKLNCRVLLVDDGPDNQRLISFILKKAGAEVTIAEHGEEALTAMYGAWPIANEEELKAGWSSEKSPFDVVLMDMQMPVMDGYTATRAMRNLRNDIPVIAVTAHAMEGDREKCLEAGCDEYLTKPISKPTLLNQIRHFLPKSQLDASII
ncbi:Autoinducer 2 sensor kinase/phosphatase LuxQ [Polystyrenella longa]|uniref:histidine kinase n=1 Tax=Polystyrenella longa TaxID=2528007 RepID=A0A518CPH5_9PLAN|nr:ATP-binding protein [Polystyrenella longa]QDU81125.1 Autoinducer 2 sensor kinase/phosphatase LuxQ [Polystyrenella longa]